MKKDNFYSSLIIVSPHTKVTTPHIMVKVKKRIKQWSVKRQFEKTGIIAGTDIRLDEVPYICYVSHCDSKINKNDFNGAIRLGNNVTLWSGALNAFPNSFIRMTIVKSTPDKIGKIIIGNNVHLQGTSIVCYDRITIADNVLFGPMVCIMDCNGHSETSRGEADEYENLITKPVEIGENAWIGYGALIHKGVSIGRNSIVGANSVVYQSVPDNTVVAGNPARKIKEL
ncbi:MAG: acyltransferase [Spirochaetales bacterium]|nr:acyltransferase [Spirochaetales bacterium]